MLLSNGRDRQTVMFLGGLLLAVSAALAADDGGDGTFVFYSARNTKKDAGQQCEAPGGGRTATVCIRNCLVALENMPGSLHDAKGWYHEPCFGNFWKQGDSRNPQIQIINNVFYVPPPHAKARPAWYNPMPSGCAKSENNVLLWMGEGPFPHPRQGFKILQGQEGRAYWEKAKADWIARHPKVGRVKGDPGYDPAIHGTAEPPPTELSRQVAEQSAANR